MVGLSEILETRSGKLSANESTRKVINKTNLMINKNNNNPASSSSSSSTCTAIFLKQCFLCRQKLLPGKDIYMYEGDKGFCSVECRCRQIFMDEEEEEEEKQELQESVSKGNCSLAAMKPGKKAKTPSSSSSSSSSSGSRHRKPSRSHAKGFAY